jgi:hypothetical protein
MLVWNEQAYETSDCDETVGEERLPERLKVRPENWRDRV